MQQKEYPEVFFWCTTILAKCQANNLQPWRKCIGNGYLKFVISLFLYFFFFGKQKESNVQFERHYTFQREM